MKQLQKGLAVVLIGAFMFTILSASQVDKASAVTTTISKKTTTVKKNTTKTIKKPIKKPVTKPVTKKPSKTSTSATTTAKPAVPKSGTSKTTTPKPATPKPAATATPISKKPSPSTSPSPTPPSTSSSKKNNLLGVDKIEFTLKSVEGAKYTSKEVFEDNKLTMINFWGITCTPCIKELPDLQALNNELAGQKFAVVGIVGDVQNTDDKETAKTIIEKKQIEFLNLLPDKMMADSIISKMSGFPVSVFVDKNGNIVGEIITGTRTKEEYKKIIESLLAKQ